MTDPDQPLTNLRSHRLMKSLSASIIVLSGAGLLLGGAFVGHPDTSMFVMFAGCVLGLVGLVGWFIMIRDSEKL